ncbi:hypothetical protein LQZ18_19025 [Lachnospiraceae bacterium ZAX-1]
MKHAINVQLSIIFHKKSFQATSLLLLLYAMGTSLFYGYSQIGQDVSGMYHPAILSALNSDGDYIWFFCRLYPFLAVIPAGFTLFADDSAKITELIVAKEGRKRYCISKMAAAFLATFFVFTVPFLLEMLLNLVMIPAEATKAMSNWETYSDIYFRQANRYLLHGVFYKNIYLYNICAAVACGGFSGCVSVFVVGVSAFRIKYRAFLLLPFYMVAYFLAILAANLNMPLSLDFYITTFDGTADKSGLFFALSMLLLLSAGAFGMVWNTRKRG